jgi:hypothetical protein
MADSSFRTYPTPEGQVYEIDGIPVATKEEFDARRAASKQETQDFRDAPSGISDLDNFAAEAKARARLRKIGNKHGGAIKIPKTKVTTGQTGSKKSSNW